MRLIKTLTIYVCILTYNIMFADNLNHTDYDVLAYKSGHEN